MPAKNEELRPHIERELEVLDRVINYADRMICEQGQREYGAVRRQAYGKTVILETEKAGRLEFRLSAVSLVLAGVGDAGYATPHSAVSRLCSSLREGDEGETPRWGEYRVLEVRLLDRFDGAQFESNVRNFMTMSVRDEQSKATVHDLRRAVARSATRAPQVRADVDRDEVSVSTTITEADQARTSTAPPDDDVLSHETPLVPEIQISAFVVVDDDGDDEASTSGELDEDEAEADESSSEPESVFTIS